MTKIYTCGIIEESLNDTQILSSLSPFLHTSRVAAMPDEDPETWHIFEYHIPEGELVNLISDLQNNVKEGWYVHAFNIAERKLYVILKDQSFLLPTEKDASWDDMIAYGETVGCDSRWTSNIPLRV